MTFFARKLTIGLIFRQSSFRRQTLPIPIRTAFLQIHLISLVTCGRVVSRALHWPYTPLAVNCVVEGALTMSEIG